MGPPTPVATINPGPASSGWVNLSGSVTVPKGASTANLILDAGADPTGTVWFSAAQYPFD